MKKLALFAVVAMAALLFTSCEKVTYRTFVGTWGVEKIEYYNTDYAGNPIASSMKTHFYDPEDFDNGIHLIFKSNKKGVMRDSAIDSLPVANYETMTIDHYIVCPDTVIETNFTYSFDSDEQALYLNLETARIYKLQIQDVSTESFIYVNEYDENYVEKAYMKRVEGISSKSSSRKAASHPHMPGSLMGDLTQR